MQFIDTHCHLDDKRFEHDREASIARANAVGVERFIVPSVCEEGWQKLKQMACSRDSIHPAFGMHPWFCERHTSEGLRQLENYIPYAVAIGECGLDFGKGRASEAEQLRWLVPQLELAEANGLPVILHAYRSLDRLLVELRKLPKLRGVVHSFSGSWQQAERIMQLGLYLGVGGVVTRPDANKLRDVVSRMPVSYLLLETDAPFQSGMLHRGERNEPAYLVEIAKEAANVRGLSMDALADITRQNSKELFHL